MTSSRVFTTRLDEEVWWKLQTEIPNGTRSKLVADLLRAYLLEKSSEPEQNLAELNTEMEQHERRMVCLKTKILKLKEEIEKKEDLASKEEGFRRQAMMRSFKAAGGVSKLIDEVMGK